MGVVLSRRTHARAQEVRRTTAVVNAFKTNSGGTTTGPANTPQSHPSTITKNAADQQDIKPPNGLNGNEANNGVDQNGRRSVVYTDTSAAWNALRSGKTTDADHLPKSEFTVPERQLSTCSTVNDGRKRTRPNNDEDIIDIPYIPSQGWESIEIEQDPNDELCTVCGVFTGTELFPCRVCDKVYHEGCLRKIGKLQDHVAIQMLDRANTVIGWSCHDCENLNSLLRDDEMFELMDAFEKCDVDSDSIVTESEFLRYKKQSHCEIKGIEMSAEEEKREIEMFKLMDVDKTGSLSWWEFLNHESARRLATRSKNALLKLLSPKEVNTARQMFRFFDKDCDGFITPLEAKHAYKKWFGKFLPDPEQNIRNDEKSKDFESHVKQQTRLLMQADSDNSGSVSWREYIEDQVLYILSVRPNIAPVQYKK